MQDRRQSSSKITRRSLVAAAAGTAALAANPASAQRCPAKPPARERGPMVWMNLDQHELEATPMASWGARRWR